jgi:hypothetical protein
MRPSRNTRPEYLAAFREIAARLARVLDSLPDTVRPIRMYVAGGAALHLHVGERVSNDIDAAFSHRIALPENLEVAYRDADGAARLLYLDRQYSDTLALLHENAYEDSEPLTLEGIDRSVLEVRVLTPIDLAVTKLSRFSEQDRDDILSLARNKLITSERLRVRATEALSGYVGDTNRVRGSIELACRIVGDATQARRPAPRRR